MAPENVNSGEMLTREQVMYEKGPSSGTPQRYAAAATRPSQRLHQLGRRRGARAAALAGVPRSHGRTSHNEARFQVYVCWTGNGAIMLLIRQGLYSFL
ncbi:hypothetical protein SORBI_3004G045632 [Sorghum bicolor]|uniref:Uncharacterized protein n=1 Tax=Sorghum bicolor TaxID=4558 RepID=A0A1Z5RLZ9_SORBI|nr:hypothetical protein SORBI_3004G045632 [Sorghum bicolor]OQU84397.1 hypothetical protein SORBI_3004G045632 [Sorghum bicolor]